MMPPPKKILKMMKRVGKSMARKRMHIKADRLYLSEGTTLLRCSFRYISSRNCSKLIHEAAQTMSLTG
jgi:hypothetical protein